MAAPVTVLLQMKIPFEMLERMKNALGKMEAAHVKEFNHTQQRLKSTADEKVAVKFQSLRKRGRKLTIHNVARLAMEYGLGILDDVSASLEKIAEEGMSKGRPKDA